MINREKYHDERTVADQPFHLNFGISIKDLKQVMRGRTKREREEG
jgi:hypothetical protein